MNFGNALKQPADAQLGIEESELKDSAGRQQQYLPRLRNLLPNRHPPASDSATGLKQHSGVTGASFAEAGLMPNWRRANCITNSARNRRVDLLARTGAKFVVNKSSINADAFIEPVFEHPSLSLLSSRLQATVAGKESETRASAKFASSLRSPPVELRVEAAALALSSNLPSDH